MKNIKLYLSSITIAALVGASSTHAEVPSYLKFTFPNENIASQHHIQCGDGSKENKGSKVFYCEITVDKRQKTTIFGVVGTNQSSSCSCKFTATFTNSCGSIGICNTHASDLSSEGSLCGSSKIEHSYNRSNASIDIKPENCH